MRSSRCRDRIVTVPVWRERGACGKSYHYMSPPPLSRIHLDSFVSVPDRRVPRLRALIMPGVWPGLCIAGMVLAAWPSVKMLAATRDSLDRTERARLAMEQALRRSRKMEALGRLTI